MGVHPLISHDAFPVQSDAINQRLEVRLPSDEQPVYGIVVRDDVNFPRLNRRIIQLDDGRYLLVQATIASEVAAAASERGPLDETENPIFAHGGYPKQGTWHLKRTRVCFRYDTEHIVMGTVARDDIEAPYETIIALDDGRWVLAGECMHSPE